MEPARQEKAGRLELVTSDDGCVLLDLDHDRLLRLNLVAAEMWTLLSSGRTEPDIVRYLAEKYQVTEERVAADLSDLMQRINELGAAGMTVSRVDDLDSSQFISHPSFPWYGSGPSETVVEPSAFMVAAAFIGLVVFDVVLWLFSMKTMCRCVNRWPRRNSASPFAPAIGPICTAVSRACIWYPSKPACLQRSAVTACLLRSFGIPGVMKIGVRPMPFQAHAWVEVDGSVVNDWPRVKQFYRPLLSN